MLENILSTAIKNLTDKHELTEYQVKQLKKYVELWDEGEYIYPSTLKSKLNVDIVKTYKMLEVMRKMGILQRSYEVYCPNCHRFKGKILTTLTEVDPDLNCDFCNHDFDPLEDTIMIYKVLPYE
ncbi:hypothetical protein ABE039_20780 [Priestia megaterium]